MKDCVVDRLLLYETLNEQLKLYRQHAYNLCVFKILQNVVRCMFFSSFIYFYVVIMELCEKDCVVEILLVYIINLMK